MAQDYFVLVFIAAVGVYQIAAIPAGLRGLWFFNHRGLQCLFGAAVIAGAFAWFYATGERNVQHRVEGAQQLSLFLAAIVLAYLCTGIVASIVHLRSSSAGAHRPEGKASDVGMQALKNTTLLGAILGRLRKPDRRED
jgi:hypothetical protein